MAIQDEKKAALYGDRLEKIAPVFGEFLELNKIHVHETVTLVLLVHAKRVREMGYQWDYYRDCLHELTETFKELWHEP